MIQQAKLAYDQGYVHLIVNTHTIEADFTAANNRPTVTFSLFALMSDVWCAQQVVLVYQD